MSQATTKDRIRAAIEELPEDATVADAMERLYFLQKIERGLADAEAGRTLSHDQVRRRIEAWRQPK